MDPTYPLIPTISILCAILALIPFPWPMSHWNTGAWMYGLWVSLGYLIQATNEIVWKDNIENVAPVWCDITVRFDIGLGIAIPASSLAITRRVYLMFSLQRPLAGTRAEKRNAILFDLGLTIGIPTIQMILYYVIQGHRFNILEEYGCLGTHVNVWLAFPLFYCWPLVCGLISCFYCALIIRLFLKRRRNLKNFDSPTDFSRYYRVLALGCAGAVFTVPCSILVLLVNSVLQNSVVPWTGWADVHYNFSRVDRVPAILWKLASFWQVFSVRWNMWVSPACAFIFFCFFGTTKEVRVGYERFFTSTSHKLSSSRFNLSMWKGGVPAPALDISEFRVDSFQRTTNYDALLTSVFSSGTIETTEFRGISTESTTDAESVKNKSAPLDKDALKPVDVQLSASEQV